MDIRARLEALAAAPREWRVTTHYADGATREHDTHTQAGAENFATGERRRIGRDLISRETGMPVRVVDVTVARIRQ
ncbi:MAG: hypothetical protein GY873_30210 [Bosea sp.]|uniref:hypothetical protein n=1 Tax=Bosea sp. (in: a-proteobacteria) TaxID=1871050 RepID=UPI00239432D8|nr:hypothetical protein [Bosea sp. (in: a-proteobacteria)]MCP4738470.1 hypothetical protein [Bosea sp. (in: a-proteobacteria)]